MFKTAAPFMSGFLDELIKVGVSELGSAAAAGTGIKPPAAIKPGKPPAGPTPIDAPKFRKPPGLKAPRLPRFGTGMPKLPSNKPRLPNWQRPG